MTSKHANVVTTNGMACELASQSPRAQHRDGNLRPEGTNACSHGRRRRFDAKPVESQRQPHCPGRGRGALANSPVTANRNLHVAAAVILLATTFTHAEPTPQPKENLRELFPGVRADPANKAVEFDAEVIADFSDPKKILYLEVLACPRDSKEHESLLMTRCKPSQVHAALLLAGFVPGKPVQWADPPKGSGGAGNAPGKPTATPPTGDPVKVEFIWTDPPAPLAPAPAAPAADTANKPTEHRASPLEWVVNAKDGTRASTLNHGFVFAGSVMIKRPNGTERYDADSDGTLIGLASFGTETIAWTHPFSPEAGQDEPVWTADRQRVPKLGTKVVVRVTAEKAEPRPDAAPAADPSGKEK
jgi:hypothetical protein